ncbi:MAG: hypothetical protein U1E14_05495 [Geminicoccaceae bacterium]
MESWIRALKIFVVVGGVVLVLGTGLLFWLLVQRNAAERAAARDTATAVAELALPAGSRIEQVDLDGSRMALLLRGADQQQYLALVNPATGERLSLLRVVPESP